MRKINYAFFFVTAIFFACSNDQNANSLEKKLSNFESSLENKIPEKTSYSIETIKSPENEYDSYGENLLNSIDALFTFTEQNSTNSTFKQDFESFVQNEVVSVNPTNIEFNTEEQTLFDSFIKTLPSIDPISVAKDYENYIYINYPDQSKVKNVLIVISEFKYAEFATRKRKTLAQVEACADDCMESNYSSYGVVKWVQFAFNPGLDVLWSYADCIEKCL